MSSTENTVMVAKVNVTSAGPSPTVTATGKVKTRSGTVIWRVRNNTGSTLDNVKMTNFVPTGSNTQSIRVQSGSADDIDTGPIPSGHIANIPAQFDGDPGQLYTYEIWVNGTMASDPQLEI